MTERIDPDDPWDGDDGSELEAEIMRADHAFGVESKGTTPEEAIEGQSLDESLARERREGRITEETLGIVDDGALDEEDELVAEASVEHDDFGSPEEAALSVRDEAPGATDHDDPHPADES
jgi:hypothetical protein